MKRLEQFLTKCPSYMKVSRVTVAKRLNLAVSTVDKFWKTTAFKKMYSNKYGK